MITDQAFSDAVESVVSEVESHTDAEVVVVAASHEHVSSSSLPQYAAETSPMPTRGAPTDGRVASAMTDHVSLAWAPDTPSTLTVRLCSPPTSLAKSFEEAMPAEHVRPARHA